MPDTTQSGGRRFDAALKGAPLDYYDNSTPNLLDRWNGHAAWWDRRAKLGLDPYSKSTHRRIAPEIVAETRTGERVAGVNFASQEYLSLASHPRVIAAATAAAQEYGVHSAGSPALMGNTSPTLKLEEELARFLGLADCTLFSTGWSAGFGAITTLAHEGDNIVIDALAHNCLHEGARHSGAEVHIFPHLSNRSVRSHLQRLRKRDRSGGVLVVTESVFSRDSDRPDLRELQDICREFEATLMVDAAHDLGCIGPEGGGNIELQGMTGKIDLVMGSFSKTFASNGGFVASNHPALKLAIRFTCSPHTFSNALSPMQASIVRTCIEIIRSEEGRERRARLLRNIEHMRGRLREEGFEVLGQPSAIVPVILGDADVSWRVTREALRRGAVVNQVEHPAVPRDGYRCRLQMMADHTEAQIEGLVEVLVAARATAAAEVREVGEPAPA